jgi:hypothetical protein
VLRSGLVEAIDAGRLCRGDDEQYSAARLIAELTAHLWEHARDDEGMASAGPAPYRVPIPAPAKGLRGETPARPALVPDTCTPAQTPKSMRRRRCGQALTEKAGVGEGSGELWVPHSAASRLYVKLGVHRARQGVVFAVDTGLIRARRRENPAVLNAGAGPIRRDPAGPIDRSAPGPAGTRS